MTKNILLFGAVAVAGYFTFSAFGPKQNAQKAEITQMVTAKLEDLRAEKVQECDERVATESKKRFEEEMAAMVPEVAAPIKGMASKKMVKKGSKGPKVDPLPQTNPTSTKPASQGKWEQGGKPGESQKKWEQAPANSTTPGTTAPSESKSKWQKAGGGGGK